MMSDLLPLESCLHRKKMYFHVLQLMLSLYVIHRNGGKITIVFVEFILVSVVLR